MKRLRFFSIILLASVSGVFCCELVCQSAAFHDYVGQRFGELVLTENLRRASRNEEIDSAKVDREVALCQAQFGDEEAFLQRLGENELAMPALRELITDQLRALQWLEKKIAVDASHSTEAERRSFYDLRHASFVQPARYRVSHIFLAAPAETPPDVIETKRSQINAIAVRLAQGEIFSDLAAEASDDEATKWIGGDLGFFSAKRMPEEFFSQIEKLTIGRPSGPFQSHLGFHIVQVTDKRPLTEVAFEQAQNEISLALANQSRVLIAGHLADMLRFAADPTKKGSARN